MRTQFKISLLVVFLIFSMYSFGQFRPKEIDWTPDGTAFLRIKDGGIVKTDVKTGNETMLVTSQQLTPDGSGTPLSFRIYSFSPDYKMLLIFTNTAKVWRYHTRGDYWVLDIPNNKLIQLGKGLPSQSLMYAKISPDGKNAAYVGEHNLYMEDLA